LETELIDVLKKVGLEEARVADHFDCFRGTSKESVARKFGVQGVNVYARRPVYSVKTEQR
jgi:hypothetical protein